MSTIDALAYEIVCTYPKTQMKHVVAVALEAEVDTFLIKLSCLEEKDDQLDKIKQHFNAFLHCFDPSHEWEEFTVNRLIITELVGKPLVDYQFRTKGGAERQAREKYYQLTFIN